MCLIAIAWRAHPRYSLVVAANRDEWRERPAQAAHWWPDHPELLAGRDLKAGGTWMGVTKGGRFAAVTNFRDPSDKRSTALSRGALVTEFLLDRRAPAAFLADLAARAALFNGFNLIVGDGHSLLGFGSRDPAPFDIAPGVHGLSNHRLDEPWPKVIRARAAMEGALADLDPAPRLFEMLADARGCEDSALPDTGVGLEWERRLAAPLIVGEDYGTRVSTLLTMANDGAMRLEERAIGPGGAVEGVRTFGFD